MPELSLVLDTSVRGAAVVALTRRSEVLESRKTDGSAPTLQPALAALVRRAGDQLLSVACARGPGSYMGVRSGLAAAVAVAQGRRVRLDLLGSLEIVAARLDPAGSPVLALRDAGRGGRYGQLFSPGPEGERPWIPMGPSRLLDRDGPWPAEWSAAAAIADPDRVAPPGTEVAEPVRSQDEAMALAAWAARRSPVPYDLVTADHALRFESLT